MTLADSLADALAQPTVREAEYRPKTVFDGREGFIQTKPLADAPASHDAILREFGYDPTEVRIVGNPRISKWQTYDERWLTAYRFQLAPVVDALPDLVAIVDRHEPHVTVGGGRGAFVFQAGDFQLGKVDGDGTDGTISRYLDSIDVAVAEYEKLARVEHLAAIQLCFPGDLCEGNVSQGGANMWRTQLTITEQMRLLRRLFMHTVERFAPLTDCLYLDVVNGNHDEAQRAPVSTRPDDGHATEQAIAVADALKLNPAAFGHVTVRVPPLDQHWMTVDVAGTVVTVAHGHKWRRGKALDWLANQALNMTNVAATQVLQHGHEHQWSVTSTAARTVICSPAYDGGSNWLGDGSQGRRGGLTYTLHEGDVRNMRIV